MSVLGRRPSCIQAEPLRLSWALRLGEASQALAVPVITAQLQWRSQPVLTDAPKLLLLGIQMERKGKLQP